MSFRVMMSFNFLLFFANVYFVFYGFYKLTRPDDFQPGITIVLTMLNFAAALLTARAFIRGIRKMKLDKLIAAHEEQQEDLTTEIMERKRALILAVQQGEDEAVIENIREELRVMKDHRNYLRENEPT